MNPGIDGDAVGHGRSFSPRGNAILDVKFLMPVNLIVAKRRMLWEL
jgi:hypothetical protein